MRIVHLLFVLAFFISLVPSRAQCCSNGVNMLATYNPEFTIPGDPIPPGFRNDNIYAVDLGAGLYSVITSRNYGACSASPEYDHTSGDTDGRYLWFDTAGDASETSPAVAWVPFDPARPEGEENTLDVIPNTEYVFSVWIRDLAREPDCINGGAPIMGLRINGLDLAEINLGDYTSPCCPEWIYLCASWNSGSATTVLIQIESRTGNGWTDLGIDDVYFGTTFANYEDILGDDITTCEEGNVVLDPEVTRATLHWSDGSSADTLLVTAPGIYWVDIEQSGCIGRDSILVSITDTVMTISLGPDVLVCEGISLVLAPDPLPPGTYLWQDGTTAHSIIVDEPGLYWLSVSGVCGNASDSVQIDYDYLPDVTLPADLSLCTGEGADIFASAEHEDGLLWSDTSTGYSITVDEAGMYWISAYNDCGTVSDTIQVTAYESALNAEWEVNAVPDFCGKSLLVNGTFTGTGATTVTWDNGEGNVVTGNTFSFFYTGVNPSLYLTATGFCDEAQYLSQTFILEENHEDHSLIMPNIFTPNSDGDNDRFLPFPLEVEDGESLPYSLDIYNRWGQQVFHSTKANTGWNGSFNGNPCDPGVYFFIVEYFHPCNDATRKYDGSLTLLR